LRNRDGTTLDTTSKATDDQDSIAAQEQQKKRLSAYSFSNLPEVVSWSTHQGKEVAPLDGKVVRLDDHKEAVAHRERASIFAENSHELCDEKRDEEMVPTATGYSFAQKPTPTKERLNRRVCGIRVKWSLLGLAVLIILIISLGTGLGVALRSK
jgi:hypothetical protein